MGILTKSEIDMIGGGGESSVDTRSKKGLLRQRKIDYLWWNLPLVILS